MAPQRSDARALTATLGYWKEWGEALAQVDSVDRLRHVLAEAALALADAAGSGGGLSAVGVDVVDAHLPDGSGGIIDRWERKTVVVDRRHTDRRRRYVVAHEVGHLLLGYVHRSRRLTLGREDEEQLCDWFADDLTTLLAAEAITFE